MNPNTSALLTDLYQLTMLQSYYQHDMDDIAVFEFFVRKLPATRGFLLAAGLDQALQFLEQFHVSVEELNWLRSSGKFSTQLIDQLARARFTGDVHAMPEGTVFFPDEPILRVTAPITQAQLVESRLINILHVHTLIASKAARCVLAAPNKLLIEFGLRRAHGAEAGMVAARASYLAGFAGTSNVLAAAEFGMPMFGTMAHSYVQAHDNEAVAFEHYARSHPLNTTLLIDTYDTEAAAEKAVALAARLQADGIRIQGVRLDSGDLFEHATKVRAILDRGGLHDVTIFSSGNLDEYVLRDLLARGAPIDGFGVGTHMDTSNDAPHLDCAYKLQEYAGRARRKRSEGKATWPGRKQVYRSVDTHSRLSGDVLTLESDPQPGTPLIVPVMQHGKRIAAAESLDTIRARAVRSLAALPTHLHELATQPHYEVRVAKSVKTLAAKVDADGDVRTSG